MKIQLVSDLHTEFYAENIDSFVDTLVTDADVIVLAGDIGTRRCLSRVLRAFCDRYAHVIMVSGNHEYYESSARVTCAILLDAAEALPNLHVLDARSSFTIDRQRFIGGTLWYPDNGRRDWSDFHAINDFASWLGPTNARHAHFLREHVREEDIVVTHMLPSEMCIHRKYIGSPENCFFVTPMDDVIEEIGPKLWLHGHTHESIDVTAQSGTRIICNPYGYAGHVVNPLFDPKLILEV